MALYVRDKGSTAGPFSPKVYLVTLMGNSVAVVLSHIDNREEALGLAQAVSKLLGLSLRVEGGQSRSVSIRMEEAPLTEECLPTCPMAAALSSGRAPWG
ncbi:hypothetical protein D7W82_08790 [Corallococcus sp. CA049B]|uniref:hypothetical protein n=1 Tax=Corallococcus sp. CA049B TaxID=2316730 RepID=UPI000EA23DDA|nr:hypothetical protein [Corallococcus sp. CA049B]RKG88913.1 hypothetical protein D7W82_08790 [Corallococcus sp. CA049B]